MTRKKDRGTRQFYLLIFNILILSFQKLLSSILLLLLSSKLCALTVGKHDFVMLMT